MSKKMQMIEDNMMLMLETTIANVKKSCRIEIWNDTR